MREVPRADSGDRTPPPPQPFPQRPDLALAPIADARERCSVSADGTVEPRSLAQKAARMHGRAMGGVERGQHDR